MTKYLLTITQIHQGRKSGGQLPAPESMQMFQQNIEQKDVARVVAFLNTDPKKKVSSDGVVTEIVKP